MKPLTTLAPALVLSLLPVLAGCPKRSDSVGSSADAAAATPAAESAGRAVQCLAEARNGDLLIGIAQNNVPTEQGLVLIEGFGVYRLAKGATASVQIADGLPHANVRAIVVTPSGALLAATMEGIFRSADDGAKWVPASTTPQPKVYGMLLTRTGKLFAATNQGLLASSDDGKTWAAIGENRGEVNAVIEHPTLGLFAGTDKGVIHSADGSNPWESVGLTKETVLTLAIDAKGELLAGTTASDVATGVANPGLAIMDEMIGWKGGVLRYTPPAVAADAGPADNKGKGKAPAGKKPGKTAAPAGDASVAGGGQPDASDTESVNDALDARWKPTGMQNTTIWAMTTLADGTVLAATHTRGLQRLDPASSTWSAVPGIARENPVASLLVTSSGIYAGAVHGLFRSTDQGRTFQRATQE